MSAFWTVCCRLCSQAKCTKKNTHWQQNLFWGQVASNCCFQPVWSTVVSASGMRAKWKDGKYCDILSQLAQLNWWKQRDLNLCSKENGCMYSLHGQKALSGIKRVVCGCVCVANCRDINTLRSTEVANADWLDIHLVFGHVFSKEKMHLKCKWTLQLRDTAGMQPYTESGADSCKIKKRAALLCK